MADLSKDVGTIEEMECKKCNGRKQKFVFCVSYGGLFSNTHYYWECMSGCGNRIYVQ